jgi:hypothetical protein
MCGRCGRRADKQRTAEWVQNDKSTLRQLICIEINTTRRYIYPLIRRTLGRFSRLICSSSLHKCVDHVVDTFVQIFKPIT